MGQESPTGRAEPATAQAAPRPGVAWLSVWVLLLAGSAVLASTLQIALGRPDEGLFLLLATVGLCAVASWFDAATWRIPNQLTYTAILLGLAVNGLVSLGWAGDIQLIGQWAGAPGIASSLLGLAVCGAIGLICLYAGGMGGGDMKLLAALGALLGFGAAFAVLVYALLAAVLFALADLIWRGRLTATLHELAWAMLLLRTTGRRVLATGRQRHVPLAIPVLIGLIASQFAPPPI